MPFAKAISFSCAAAFLLTACLMAENPTQPRITLVEHTPAAPESVKDSNLKSPSSDPAVVRLARPGRPTLEAHRFLQTIPVASKVSESLEIAFHTRSTLTSISANNDFRVLPGGTCREGQIYEENQTCTIDVEFHAMGLGNRAGQLKFAIAESARPLVVGLQGTTTGPAVAFDPAQPASAPPPHSTVSSAAAPKQQMHLAKNYGKLSLVFEANQGQTDGHVKFLSRGSGYALFLTGDEAVLSLRKATGVPPTGARPYLVGRSADAQVAPRPTGAAVPGLLSLSGPNKIELEKSRERTADPALPISSRRFADSSASSTVLRMRLVGANPSATATGANELPGKSNYFIGNDPKKWRTCVPNYAQVRYRDVYPGVDLVYYGNQGGQLEYDFVVAPGADPAAIRFALSGGLEADSRRWAAGSENQNPTQFQSKIRYSKSRIDPSGDLVVKTDGGEVRFQKPVLYQPPITNGRQTADDGQRTSVDGHYVLQANNQVGFQVASYDHTRPLFIDPTLSYSTYLGGSNYDYGLAIAIDPSGNAYVTGQTFSTDFPTLNPINGACGDCTGNDGTAFVAKLNAAGSALVYSTYLGGTTHADVSAGYPGNDWGAGIAADSSGNAYVTGYTNSTDFPTANAYQPANSSGNGNAFVTKLSPDGSALVYSTYLGGSVEDHGYAIAIDSSNNAYVTGQTDSTDFPLVNPIQATCCGVFVSEFNAAGSALLYSTYLGGGGDAGLGIAVDSSGDAYVTGYTNSSTFPLVNPIQPTNLGSPAAFVAEVNSSGTGLVYSTYLGGHYENYGQGIAVDSSGNTYVTGYTGSNNFPTANPFQPTNPDYSSAFVAKLSPGGLALVYSSYLGGSSPNWGYGIAADSSGNAYVTGYTHSTDFPIVNSFQSTCGSCAAGGSNAFVAEVNPTGSALVYSSYLGGSGQATNNQAYSDFTRGDAGLGIAVDSSGNAYVVGSTPSEDFPTVNPILESMPGIRNAFVAKISTSGVPIVSLSPTYLIFGPQLLGVTSAAQTVTLTNTGTGNLNVSPTTFGSANSGDFYESADTCSEATLTPTPGPGSTCTVSVIFTPSAAGNRIGSLIFNDNASNSPESVSLMGTYAAPVAGVSPPSLAFGNQNLGTTSAAQSVTLSNTAGTAALTINSIAASANFGLTNACGGSVAAGSACTLFVTFSPTATGSLNGTLTITDNSNGVTGSVQTVNLGGTGTVPVASLSPSLSFGNQLLGTTSATQTVTLTNTGTGNLTVSSPVMIGGTNPGDFAKGADTCSGAMISPAPGPGNTCTVNVTFTPMATGSRSASLTFTDNSNAVTGSMQTVNLGGTGTAPVASLSPSLTFGNQLLNSTSTAQTVTLTNNGTANLTFSSPVMIGGANRGDFAKSADTCSGSTLIPAPGPGSTCTVSVTFTPLATGNLSASLIFADNSNGVTGSMQSVALTGTGTVPVAGVSPPGLTFRSQNIGTTSASQPVTLSDTGTAPVTINSIVTSANFGQSGGTCGGSLAPTSSCTINVTFSPTAAGTLNGTLTITDNTNAVNGSQQTVSLSGTGVYVPAAATVSPTSLSFGSEVITTPSAAKRVTLTSTGTINLVISSITISGADAGDFSETNTCTAASYAPGAKCTIEVTYTPSILGAESASLIVTDNAATSQTVALSGAGGLPVVLDPISLDFGKVGENRPSTAKNIALHNLETVSLKISSIKTGNPDFTETDTCDGTVPAAGNCVITVTLTPSTIGGETGTLTVTDAASNSPQTASLSGTGVVPVVVSPTSLTFTRYVGNTSAAKNVTLTNHLLTPLALSITFTGADASDFDETDTCGGSLAANSHCTISVTFTPEVGGTRTATMNINDGASNSPQTVELSGTGFNPVVLAPTPLNFGSQLEYSTSAPQTVALTNRQSVSLVISNITVSKRDYSQTNTCGSSVPAHGTCTITITFSPTSSGGNASLSVIDGASNSPQTVRLAGQGVPGPKLEPTFLDIPDTQMGYASAAKTVTVINNSKITLPISITFTAGNSSLAGKSEPSDFAETDNCGGSIPGSGRCTISVTFTPQSNQTLSSTYVATATMTVNDGSSKPPTVELEGTGVTNALVGTTPSSLAFAPQAVGTASAAQTVIFFNKPFATAIVMGNITFTGANPGDFSQTNTCGGTLAGSSSCLIYVTFTPGATGPRTATMNINDSAYNTPQTVRLTGAGQ